MGGYKNYEIPIFILYVEFITWQHLCLSMIAKNCHEFYIIHQGSDTGDHLSLI